MPRALTKLAEKFRTIAISEANKKLWQDEQVRQRRISGLLKHWASPTRAKRHSAAILAGQTLEVRQRQAESLSMTLKDPSVKIRCIVSQRARWLRPESRLAHSRIMKRVMRDKRIRAKISQTEKLQFKNGRKMSGAAVSTRQVSKNEFILLAILRKAGIACEHQYAVVGTRYKADIFIPHQNLIVEIDGHPSHYSAKGRRATRRRDLVLRRLGYRILHLRTRQIKKGMESCSAKVLATKEEPEVIR